jgi:hypothetical protein
MHPSPTRHPTLSRLTISAVLMANLSWFIFLSSAAAESTAAPDAGTAAASTGQAIAASAPASPEAAPPVTCEYGCEDHREGTEICINKKQHRCGKQGWHPTGLICAAPPPVVK